MSGLFANLRRSPVEFGEINSARDGTVNLQNLGGALVCAVLVGVTAADAQEIALTSPDGATTMRGRLTAFEEGVYTIETAVGTFNIDSALMTCEGEACPSLKPPVAEFAISGPAALTDLIAGIVQDYAGSLEVEIAVEANDDGMLQTLTDADGDDVARIQSAATSDSEAFVGLLTGESAIALSSRAPSAEEATAFENSGLGVLSDVGQTHVLALEGLVIVTAPGNPVSAISESDAAAVFSGTIASWADLGGENAPINLYMQAPETGIAEIFAERVMQPAGAEPAGNARIVAEDEDMAALVADDPFGIGFTGFADLGAVKPLAIKGSCGARTAPTAFNIKSEDYPLTQRLYAYTTALETPEQVAGLLQFAQSGAAQELVSSADLVDQTLLQTSVDEQGLRFANAIAANETPSAILQFRTMVLGVLGSERLSTTFRFETGSDRLDARAVADIARLADRITSLGDAGAVVQLIGFTDTESGSEGNQTVSLDLATQVRDALLTQDPALADLAEFRLAGYGEASPITCGDNAYGEWINRRVEVWIGAGGAPAAE